MVETVAWVEGQNRKWLWLRIPALFGNRILTMPRKTLPRGMGRPESVVVLADPASLKVDSVHYVADLKVLRVEDPGTTEEAEAGKAG